MKRRWLAPVMLMPLLAASSVASALPFSGLYVLGDSLSDQGNLKAATTQIGGEPNSVPASDHYVDGRFSNGPVYTDFLAQRLGLTLTPSLLGGTNFAYGGARTDYNLVEQRAGGPLPDDLFPWSLSAQVSAFQAASILDPSALYIVFSGSNDVGDMVRNNLDAAVVIPNAVDTILDAVQAFKNAGARQVVVGNVADLGLTPAFLRPGPLAAGLATARSQQFNELLHTRLGMITGLDIIELDVFNFVRELVADPGMFGLTNVTDPCYSGFVAPDPLGTECGTPDEFLFWDVVHPTTFVHSLLAQRLLAEIPEPSTLLLAVPLVLALLSFRGRSLAGRT